MARDEAPPPPKRIVFETDPVTGEQKPVEKVGHVINDWIEPPNGDWIKDGVNHDPRAGGGVPIQASISEEELLHQGLNPGLGEQQKTHAQRALGSPGGPKKGGGPEF